MSSQSQVPQRDVLTALHDIAPLCLAASWDNVGMILDGPCSEANGPAVSRLALTIDLTEPVVDEILAQRAEFVVSYHPPIFQGLKRLTATHARGRSLIRLLQARVAVYSPHTALDAAVGGINDWLLEGLGELSSVAPIVPAPESTAAQSGAGQGRVAHLAQPARLSELVLRIKAHLDLRHVRVASLQTDPNIRRVAVCPGAGGSLFDDAPRCDLLLTGEMRHHDVLGHCEDGRAVVLTDHTHTERGYLRVLEEKLHRNLGGRLHIYRCTADADPLRVV